MHTVINLIHEYNSLILCIFLTHISQGIQPDLRTFAVLLRFTRNQGDITSYWNVRITVSNLHCWTVSPSFTHRWVAYCSICSLCMLLTTRLEAHIAFLSVSEVLQDLSTSV